MLYHRDALADSTLVQCTLGPGGGYEVPNEHQQTVPELLEVWQWSNASEHTPYHTLRRLSEEGVEQMLEKLDATLIQLRKIHTLKESIMHMNLGH